MSQDLKASVSFVGDGITTKFYFGFDYINKQFIKVTIGSDDTLLSYPSDYIINEKEVELVEAPAKGTPIRIYRQTDTSRIIEWTDGTFIKASQMTLENVQQLHLIEEAQDYVIINGMSKYPDGVNFNALGARVINVSDPKEPQDAVTKHYMESVQDGFVSRNTSLLEQATTQATNAKNSASSSATSASQSASSASASETSNQSAKKWAESTASPDNQADTDSTTGKTQSSRSWALYSKAKAQEAATSETNAKTQAEIATTQATNAKNSASQSANSASASATSASNAKTSETNAKTSETQAGTYAGNSKTSADAAKASETNAKTSETNAAKSAKQAAESAGVFQDFKGATASADGNGGKVPTPLAGQQDKVLKADGTWGDDGWTPTLLNDIDLNNVFTPRTYNQLMNSKATTACHYPVNSAGSLLVCQNGANGIKGCTQIYLPYDTEAIYIRTYYVDLAVWSDWSKMALYDLNGALRFPNGAKIWVY